MAPAIQILELQPPIAGLNRALSYQGQPPYSSPDCLNARPFERSTGRLRVGSRPGLERAWPTALTHSITMLGQVPCVGRSIWQSLTYDNFDSAILAPEWSSPIAGVASSDPLHADDAGGFIYGVDLWGFSILHNVIAGLTPTTNAYRVEIDVVPKVGVVPPRVDGLLIGQLHILLQMNDATPNFATDSVEVWIYFDVPTDTVTNHVHTVVYKFVSGMRTAIQGATADITFPACTSPIRITLNIGTTPNMTGTMQLPGSTEALFGGSALALPAAVGNRIGIWNNSRMTSQLAGFGIGYFGVKQEVEMIDGIENILSAANDAGELWNSKGAPEMVKLTGGNVDLSPNILQCADRLQKLYIADYTTRLRGTDGDGAITSAKLTDHDVADWTTHGIDADTDVVHIIGSSEVTGIGVYRITTIHATNGLTLTGYTAGDATGVTWRVERGAKVYDPQAGTLSLWWADDGFVPIGCKAICRYNDRLVLACDPYNPHVWYMSRQGDPLDFDYGADSGDVQRAVAGVSSNAGQIGQPITALIPFGDDYLLFGCRNSLYLCQGDPAQGGSIGPMNQQIGVIDRMAWCYGPYGEVYFVSATGLFKVAPGAGIQPVSEGKVPDELIAIDTTNYSVSMAYDHPSRGIFIFVTKIGTAGGVTTHWWYDIRNDGFWPMSFDSDHEPYVCWSYKPSDESGSRAIMGCRDGYLRQFSENGSNDDGEDLESYVLLGPITLGGGSDQGGLITRIRALMAEDIGGADLAVRVGDSPELAFRATDESLGTITAGTNYDARPRRRGVAALVKIGSTNQRWAMESVVVDRQPTGRMRKV